MGALVFVVALVLLAAFHGGTSGPRVVTAAEGDRFSEDVDGKGNISLPGDYETLFVHLGTFSVKTKAVGPKDELHGVYARPEDVAAFKRDGRFPRETGVRVEDGSAHHRRRLVGYQREGLVCDD
jgi:hypothetical protein